jgi:hypothetical protein
MGTATGRPLKGILMFNKNTRVVRLKNYMAHSVAGMETDDDREQVQSLVELF